MRLDKFLCESTELTRSQARKVISQGKISCDGQIIKNAAHKLSDDAQVTLDGRPLSLRGLRYLMLHKPVGTICSTEDEEHRSVLSLVDLPKRSTLRIGGRLDVDTTGLVLLSDDGQWLHRITAPARQCSKRYRVQLADPLAREAVEQFARGLLLRGETKPTLPAHLERVGPREALVTLTEGRYHQVKRMFAAIGNKVVALHREQIGPIALDPALAPGEWRLLTTAEVEAFAA